MREQVKKLLYSFLYLSVIAFILTTSGCKKDLLFSKSHLSFSVDTVLFDTIFTTVGSTTKRFKIYNTSNKPVKINRVFLAGSTSSPYRINFDGEEGTDFSNIVLPAKDSLFMFVEVTLNPNSGTLPLIVEDSIIFRTNGKDQQVQLAAWGQDAYFHHSDVITGTTTWPNDKPHVIYNYSYVDTNATLNIQAGTKIYMHKGAMLIVDGGTLNVNGTSTDKVTVQSDRLEPFYADKNGQYYGFYFNYAHTSTLNYLIMKNGTVGIHVTGNNSANGTDYTVKINHSQISNMASYGIFNYEGGRIYGRNLNLYNNAYYAFFQLEGGAYKFKHCQFVSYGSDGDKPAVAIKNYFTHSDDGQTYVGAIDEGKIYNSILWGPGDNQIAYDTVGGAGVNYDFNTNFIKQETPLTGSGFTNNTWNIAPQWKSDEDNKYKIKSNSPCKDAGNTALDGDVLDDVNGAPRSDGLPDIGAFELQ